MEIEENTTVTSIADEVLAETDTQAPPNLDWRGNGYQIVTDGRVELTNQEFLKVLARNAGGHERVWIASFSADPGTSDARWGGEGVPARRIPDPVGRPDHNTFYSIGTVARGALARRKTHAARVHAIVADDFGVKSSGELKLPPSYVIETSPGSYHVGYLLAEPVDPETRAGVQKALAVQGLAGDPGADGPLRYVRLPVGRNTKAKYRTGTSPEGFDHVLREWHPARRYSVEQLVSAYDLRLDDIRPQTRSKHPDVAAAVPKEVAKQDPYLRVFEELGLLQGSLRNKGNDGWWHDMQCPWLADEEHGHSPGDAWDSGTAYRVGGGFKCQHSHGDRLRFPDVKAWLREKEGIDTEALDLEQRQLFASFEFEALEEDDGAPADPAEHELRARQVEEQHLWFERERVEQEAQEKAASAFSTSLHQQLREKLVHDRLEAAQRPEVDSLVQRLAGNVRSTTTGWANPKKDAAGSIEASAALDQLLKETAKATGATKATVERVLKEAGWAAGAAGMAAAGAHRGTKPDAPHVEEEEDLEDAPFDYPAPWPSPVDGAALADEVAGMFRTHVVFRDPLEADALTLWVFGTYTMDRWRVWPKVLIKSPTKRCGKTTLVDTMAAVVHRGLSCSNTTAAALFRAIERWHPTLLLDEADTFLKDDPELNGIINAGHSRRSAYVLRTVEKDGEHVPKAFSVWGPQVIAGIGEQRGTLEDRSLCVQLRRRLPGDKISPLPVDYDEASLDLRRKLKRWAKDNAARLDPDAIHPGVPVLGGNDRARDNWVSLSTIADALGGDWPARADAAYRAMNLGEPDEQDLPLRALRDVMAVFRELPGIDAIPTSTVVSTLSGIEDRPWGSWGRARGPINAHGLGRLLKAYGIHPKDKKLNGKGIKHYFREQVEEAYERYCGGWAAEDGQAEPVQVREHPDFDPVPGPAEGDFGPPIPAPQAAEVHPNPF